MFQSPPTSHRPFRDQRWSFPTRLSASWDDLVPSGPRGKPMDVYWPLDEQDLVNFRVFQNVGVMCVCVYIYISLSHNIFIIHIYIYMGAFQIGVPILITQKLTISVLKPMVLGIPILRKRHIYIFMYIYIHIYSNSLI